MFLCASLTGLRKHLFSSLSFTLDFRDTCPHIYCIKGTKKKKAFSFKGKQQTLLDAKRIWISLKVKFGYL